MGNVSIQGHCLEIEILVLCNLINIVTLKADTIPKEKNKGSRRKLIEYPRTSFKLNSFVEMTTQVPFTAEVNSRKRNRKETTLVTSF